MAPEPFPYSRSRVNKAGSRVRDRLVSGVAYPEFQDDLEIIYSYRAAHQIPLGKASMGLRSMVRTCRCEVRVSQRLKSMVTIFDKLVRQPDMAYGRMQDVGGTRAVLDSIEEVYAVQRRIQRNNRAKRVRDYIAEPAASGYRGVHVMVEYDGRTIEVQLRTQTQHEWAVLVENLSAAVNQDLKSGSGPPELLAFVKALSEVHALQEAGAVPDGALLDRLDTLRDEALKYSR